MEEQPKTNWSDCQQIFFIYGIGYGLTENLTTIRLGKEEDVKKFFETGELDTFNMRQRQVLLQIKEYREELYGTGESNLVGASIDGTFGGNKETTRQTTPRKRLASRSSKQKGKNIFRR